MKRKDVKEISKIIMTAAKESRQQTVLDPESEYTTFAKWPVNCVVGPGLEGAIACKSKVGYVNGSKGCLIYRGYDIFDLCAHSTFEEVSYLLLHGHLPMPNQLNVFTRKLVLYRNISNTIRLLMSFPVEHMNTMAALRLGTNLMRQEYTYVDQDMYKPDFSTHISSDEDSIPMETLPRGEEHAIYEFKRGQGVRRPSKAKPTWEEPANFESCYHLVSGVASIAAAITRIRHGYLPINPDPELSHAGNFLYMLTGRRPSPVEERIMDIALILHADHGMNASTFSTLVVASTLSDIFFAVGSGIAALNGPLHGGANEQVLHMLKKIGSPENVSEWYEKARAKKRKIMGFGHRVYKAYDPRARVLGPLAEYLIKSKGDKEMVNLFRTARELEKKVVSTLGATKSIFPNVDFYSGIVYSCLGIPVELFTPVFAVSRVSGWTARVMEYLESNRIFRPRAIYTGPFDKKYVSLERRG